MNCTTEGQKQACEQVVINMRCGCGGGEAGSYEDTGWKNIIGESFATDYIQSGYTGEDSINDLKYRKINGVVFIQGRFKIVGKKKGVPALLFKLPEGYMPNGLMDYIYSDAGDINNKYGYIFKYIFQEDGVYMYYMYNIRTDEEVVGDTAFLQINVSYPV